MQILSKRLSNHLMKEAVKRRGYVVRCRVYLTMKKSFYLLVMCCKLLHCQEIAWCISEVLISVGILRQLCLSYDVTASLL